MKEKSPPTLPGPFLEGSLGYQPLEFPSKVNQCTYNYMHAYSFIFKHIFLHGIYPLTKLLFPIIMRLRECSMSVHRSWFIHFKDYIIFSCMDCIIIYLTSLILKNIYFVSSLLNFSQCLNEYSYTYVISYVGKHTRRMIFWNCNC